MALQRRIIALESLSHKLQAYNQYSLHHVETNKWHCFTIGARLTLWEYVGRCYNKNTLTVQSAWQSHPNLPKSTKNAPRMSNKKRFQIEYSIKNYTYNQIFYIEIENNNKLPFFAMLHYNADSSYEMNSNRHSHTTVHTTALDYADDDSWQQPRHEVVNRRSTDHNADDWFQRSARTA